MDVTARRRLPGIYFQTEVPAPPETLPRMDVAAFVGFASCGPLHLPVPVEDVVRFRDVFGEDLPLAWDAEAGETRYAHLAPAVEAFFRNGSRRCWVVRVAQGATVNSFAVPGLIRADNGRRAAVRARCAGAWSDTMRVGTILSRRMLGAENFHRTALTYTLDVTAQADDLEPGALLCLSFDDDLVLFLVVGRVVQGAGHVRLTGTQARWFRRRDVLPTDLTGATARLQTGHDEEAPAIPVRAIAATNEGYDVRLESPAGSPPEASLDPMPEPGHVLHVVFGDERELWLAINEVNTLSVEDSPPAEEAQTQVQILAQEGLWPQLPNDADDLVAEAGSLALTVKQLTFELLVWDGKEIQARLAGLALSETHPRSWTRLPIDEAIFLLEDGQAVPPEPGSLAEAAFEPRFPLAGPPPPDDRDDPPPPTFYIPLGMAIQPDAERTEGRLVPAEAEASSPPAAVSEGTSALERNGLAHFSAGLFFDPDLTTKRLGVLVAAANDKQYLRRQDLIGLHSLFSIDEVTLLALPDAVHRRWEQAETPSPDLLPAPANLTLNPLDEPDAIEASWPLVTDTLVTTDTPVTYELQQDVEPDFGAPDTFRVDEPSLDVFFDDPCSRRYFYRVRALRGTQISAWSVTRSILAPASAFEGGVRVPLQAPTLSRSAPEEPPSIRWTRDDEATAYTVQEAVDPAFLTATPLYEATPVEAFEATERGGTFFLHHDFDTQDEGLFYYRVRAVRDGEDGPWSNTVLFYKAAGQGWTVIDAHTYDGETASGRLELLSLHRAMMRFCAARGDVLALLSAPRHYREEAVQAHVALLTPDPADDAETDTGPALAQRSTNPPPLNFDEERALTYGAIYHPWLASRLAGREGAVVYGPPDGDVCGMIAARTLGQGAWIAPANVPLQGVLSLDPGIGRAAWRQLLTRQINLVRPDPRGFVLLSADTLSADTALRSINVRRLLILLRRLALREGNTYVFESNSADLRRRIFYQFEAVLSTLYRRGAFAGATTAEAYQVVTGEIINTPASIERGRLFIELRVAPAEPLAFLTVRLIQRGTEGFEVEEV